MANNTVNNTTNNNANNAKKNVVKNGVKNVDKNAKNTNVKNSNNIMKSNLSNANRDKLLNLDEFEPYKCPESSNKNSDAIFDKVPDSYTTPDGKKKYAFCTMLFGSDSYLPGVLTLAYSLRIQKTKADICIIITPDISDKTVKILEILFDKVIRVEYIIPPDKFFYKDLMERFPHYTKTYTKLNIFRFTEYEKILFMDADSLSLRHCDHPFTLNAPAATLYGSRAAQSHMIETADFAPRKKGDKYQWHKTYCDCCGHGKLIPKKYTDTACNIYKNPAYVGMSVEFMLIKPDMKTFDEMVGMFAEGEKHKYAYKAENNFLECFFTGKITGIDPRFPGFQGYPSIFMIFGMNFGSHVKPWTINFKSKKGALPEDDIHRSGKVLWNDFILWFYLFNDMMVKYPVLDKQSKKLAKLHKEVADTLIEFKDHENYVKIRAFLSTIFE